MTISKDLQAVSEELTNLVKQIENLASCTRESGKAKGKIR